MQLLSAHIYSAGTYLLGVDRKQVRHGIFCWSAEQIATLMRKWDFTSAEETRLTKIFMAHNVAAKSKQKPQFINGIGASLIDHQFKMMQEVREIADPRQTVPLTHGRIYFRTLPPEQRTSEAALFFYITPEGHATLAHVRTQDQAAELLQWEDWMEEDVNRDIVDTAIATLPEYDPFNQQSAIIHGDLIQQLITAQVIYQSFFSTDPTARN